MAHLQAQRAQRSAFAEGQRCVDVRFVHEKVAEQRVAGVGLVGAAHARMERGCERLRRTRRHQPTTSVLSCVLARCIWLHRRRHIASPSCSRIPHDVLRHWLRDLRLALHVGWKSRLP